MLLTLDDLRTWVDILFCFISSVINVEASNFNWKMGWLGPLITLFYTACCTGEYVNSQHIKSAVVVDVTPWSLVEIYRNFGGSAVGKLVPGYTESYPRRQNFYSYLTRITVVTNNTLVFRLEQDCQLRGQNVPKVPTRGPHIILCPSIPLQISTLQWAQSHAAMENSYYNK